MKNVGGNDRLVRILVGVVLLALTLTPFGDALKSAIGGWSWVLTAVGAVLLLTGLVNFCPAYTLFGINTCKK
ncbi:YgaP family membrane protein [Oryzibacter oryziterrae]|uniref:YgaP family membrane protein n=1 Tax=Oryzibacter oryziterrae TaxID=2766474 RepID=UPI001F3E386E|nr:DUF2892 domain-containing protein [Oryzibacter oryziterrae]